MYKISVTLDGRVESGGTDLIMHADKIGWRDLITDWLAVPEHKKLSKAGDDRTPAWKWLGHVYHDRDVLGIPSDNLMTAVRGGATMVKMPGGNGKQTYKKASAGGFLIDQVQWPIIIDGSPIPWSKLAVLRDENVFVEHEKVVKDLGFELFVKTVSLGQSKNIRVRPRFSGWMAKGTVTVLDDTLDFSLVKSFWENAGRYVGLCDWRPSAPKSPGPFGKFSVEVKQLK